MKIEILYKEVCNLYGDLFHANYLKQQLKNFEVIETSLLDKPAFINPENNVKLVYLGSSSEEHQELIINALMPYKTEIKDYINNGNILIATGNALEIFGKQISCNEEEESRVIPCLNILSYETTRNLSHRHNSLFLGKFNDMEILGYKSQFTYTEITNNKDYSFIEVEKGVGLSPTSKNEGIKYKNFYGTYLLGPFLVLNPYFMKYLLKLLNEKDELIYEEASLDAYNYRLKELHDPKTVFGSKHE